MSSDVNSNARVAPEQRAPLSAIQSETLNALRELIEVSGHVGRGIARRSAMSLSEVETLELLIKHPAGPTDIARHLDVTSAAVSGIVDRLVERGHVSRSPHPEDRRRVEVQITESARAEVIEQLMPMFVGLAQVDAAFSPDERAIVARYLRAAIAAVSRIV